MQRRDRFHPLEIYADGKQSLHGNFIGFEFHRNGVLTSKENCGQLTIAPNHIKTPLSSATMDTKAIIMTTMLVMIGTDIEAPTAIASKMFCSFLISNKKQIWEMIS